MNNEHIKIFRKFIVIAKKDGFSKAIRLTILWIFYKLGIKNSDPIHKRRIEISKKLDELFNSTVKYGPFKGLKLSQKKWWGSADSGSMLLGLYEKEVLNSLQEISKKYTTFIDLGAADGYYAIGVLVNNLFVKSICFEITEEGRNTIRHNAELNNVSEKVEIRGIAKKTFYNEISPHDISNAILFIDIEGAEFDLVDKETFEAFKNSIIFIELHEWLFEDGEEKLIRLKKDSFLTHKITELTMGSRDLSQFPEIKKFNDNDRWIICSEGRDQLMTWLRFDPK